MGVELTMEQLSNQIARIKEIESEAKKDKEFLKGIVSALVSSDEIFKLVTKYFEMKNKSAKNWFDRNHLSKNTPIYRGTLEMSSNDINTYNRLLKLRKLKEVSDVSKE